MKNVESKEVTKMRKIIEKLTNQKRVDIDALYENLSRGFQL